MKLSGKSFGIETRRELRGVVGGCAIGECGKPLSGGDYPFDLAGAGRTLKAARERKGVDLPSVAEALLVKKSTIHGIETGTWDTLPHSIYVKGYVRSYARYLDVEDSVEPFLSTSQLSCCAPVSGEDYGVRDDAGGWDGAITPIRTLWSRTVAICQLSALRNALLTCSSLLGLVLASVLLS
jgi:hypothetical protein